MTGPDLVSFQKLVRPDDELPRQAGETLLVEAEAASADEEPVLLQDVVADSTAVGAAAEQEETPGTLAAPPQNLDKVLPQTEPAIPADQAGSAIWQHQHSMRPGNGLTRLLPVVAWMILGAGVIGAVLSWTTIGDVEAGVRIPIPESLHTLPLGLLLGFAYLATGVLGFAFFWVSSLISVQLKDIRRLLLSENRNGSSMEDSGTEP